MLVSPQLPWHLHRHRCCRNLSCLRFLIFRRLLPYGTHPKCKMGQAMPKPKEPFAWDNEVERALLYALKVDEVLRSSCHASTDHARCTAGHTSLHR